MPTANAETTPTAAPTAGTGNPVRDALEMIMDAVGPEKALEDARERLGSAEANLAQMAQPDRLSPMDPRAFGSVPGWIRRALDLVSRVLEFRQTVAYLEARQKGEPTDSLEVGVPKPDEVARTVLRLAVVDGAPEPRLLRRALANLEDRAIRAARDLETCEAKFQPSLTAYQKGSHGVDLAQAESTLRTLLPDRVRLKTTMTANRAAADSIRQTLAKGARRALGDPSKVQDWLHALEVIRQRETIEGDKLLGDMTAELAGIETQLEALSLSERLKGGLLGNELTEKAKTLRTWIANHRVKLLEGIGSGAGTTALKADAGDPEAIEHVATTAIENPACFPRDLASQLLALQVEALCTAPQTVIDALLG